MINLLKKIESGLLLSGISTVRDEINICAKKYKCAFDIYLITVLSSSYGIIMDRAINALVHVNIFVDGINETDKLYLKEQMKLIGNLANNDTSNIGIISSASKYIFIKISEQCIHILNDKYKFN